MACDRSSTYLESVRTIKVRRRHPASTDHSFTLVIFSDHNTVALPYLASSETDTLDGIFRGDSGEIDSMFESRYLFARG
jgi:hypothetical protein